MQESKARRAELKEVEEQHVDAMIHFMYHGDYQISDCEGWSREPLTMPQVQFHISMVAMGDMVCFLVLYRVRSTDEIQYNVPSLRSYAKIRAINGIDRSNVIEMARELYQTVETPDEVRNHIASQFSCDMTRMITSVQGIAFEALLDEMPQLGVDVLKLHAREQCKGSFPNGCGCGSPRLSAPSDSSSEYQSD